MAAPIISISSDSSEESVGSHAPRVILFGAIPAIIPEVPIIPAGPIVAPKVETVSVVSPAGADGESEPTKHRPVSSSHDTLAPLSEFPLAPVVAPPGIRQRSSTLIRPGEAITFGQLYSTHLNRPCKLFVHRSLARTPRRSEAFRCWRSAPLSTPYPPTTSESSLGSSSERSIAPTPADLLPPCKRFRDSYSSEDSREEHMEVDTADAEADADIGISEGVIAHPEDSIDMGVEIPASDVREDDEEFEAEASAADTREITLEASQLVASGARASLVERIRSLRLEYLKVRAMLSIERDRIDSLRWHMALSQEEFRQVRRDRDDTRRRLRRLESYVERHLGFRP
ncbi:hypothetical protein Tco_0742789 [Tanacetum coccineum]